MATYNVTAQTRRVQYTGNGTTGNFAFAFQINATSELKVYVDSTEKSESSHYVVTLNSSTGAGTVGFTSGNHPTSSQIVTLLSDIPFARTSVYTSGGQLTSASLEDDFDTNMFIHQQTNEEIDRSLRLAEHDTISGADMTLPVKASRVGKVLGFNSSTGNPEVVNQLTSAGVTVSTVSVGGNATASVSTSGNTATFALGIPTGATGSTGSTGATGSHFGLAMTFSNSTSDADPGNGKIAFNNGTISSVSIAYVDDVDDNGVTISSFVQSWDDASNNNAKGYLQITKEGTASTFAIFKISGSVTDASGYTKVPLTHVVSNGTFSNSDGITVAFTQSGNDGAGNLTNIVEDTSPQLGGNLDMNGQDIVTTSNANIELAPNGTGKTVVKGNTNPGTIIFNCESNTHGQTVKSQPHSASVTNVLTLPPGGDQEIVGASATQTLTNKTIGVAQLSGQVAVNKGGTGATTLAGANIVTTNAQNTFTKAQLPSTFSGTNLTLDFDTYQNFILTLSAGSNSLANPGTEASQIGQTGVIVFIQPSSGNAGTISLGTDYETAESAGLTLSSANNDYDVVPYIVKADNSILLGTAQLNFG